MKLLGIHKNQHELPNAMHQLLPNNSKAFGKGDLTIFCILQETKQVYI